MNDINVSLVEAASFSPVSIEHPNAWVGHLPFAAWLIKRLRPEIFVELGTHSGNSYFAFCQAVAEDGLPTKCYAVDTWQGEEHAGFYDEEVFHKVNVYNHKNYEKFSRLLRMTFDEAVDYFSDGSIDLLHIDGLHTYEAVRHDFETWLPKLAPGAIVLFHDINVRERGFGVWKLWEEVKGRYSNHLEFIHSHGLGVLQIDGNALESPEWLLPTADFQHSLKDFFAALGERQEERFEKISLIDDIQKINSLLTEKDNQIAGLNQSLAEKDNQIAGLNQSLAEKDNQIAGLDQAIVDKDRHIANLTTITASNQGQIATLNIHIQDLLHSKSWKITEPLRWLVLQLKRAIYSVKIAPVAVRKGGGFLKTAKKSVSVYRSEGMSGIRNRMLNLNEPTQQPQMMVGDSEVADRNDYAEWIRRYDTLDDAGRMRIKEKIKSFKHTPLISIVMPVYDPPLNFLDEAIWSVRNQLYPHWEFCIADDASKNKDVRKLLTKHAKEDKRIKLVFRKSNGHISAASNSALEIATGEFVALLDNDDLLPEYALFWVAQTIVENPDAHLIYSDEDKIDKDGTRSDPYFKCDWNPYLFYSHNMISHLGVYRTRLIRDIGGFRLGVEGSQDYDLALRCIECLTEEKIIHIPRVLYHWRIHSESTAGSSDAKPYALLAGVKALNEHLTRKGINGRVELLDFGMYRIRYALPDKSPLVSLIIPTRNSLHLIQQCVESIFTKTSYANYEIVIIDNGSDDVETLRYFKKLENNTRVRILRDDRPFNYSALNNAAVHIARGELICLLNNDIEVISSDWLSEMVSLVLQEGVGAVGARLWYPNDTLQHGGVILGVLSLAGHIHKNLARGQHGYFGRAMLVQGMSAVTAACLVIKKEIYEAIGGLNETDLTIAFNDVDFCLRVREAGYRNIWTPYAELYHHESATRGYEDTPEKKARFANEVHYMQNRWANQLLNDPAYSPNLTLDYEDFSLAWPPRVDPV